MGSGTGDPVTFLVGRVGDEVAGGVEAVGEGEGGGVAGEEGGARWVVIGAMAAAGGAFDPGEVAASVGDEEVLLRRGADGYSGEVLAGTEGGAGEEGGLEAAVEGGDAVGVEEEGGGGRGGVGVFDVD